MSKDYSAPYDVAAWTGDIEDMLADVTRLLAAKRMDKYIEIDCEATYAAIDSLRSGLENSEDK